MKIMGNGYWAAATAVVTVLAGACAPRTASTASPVRLEQAREVWSDPATGLMWSARDNGKDLSWSAAWHYCRNLQLAGYNDWHLPSIPELQGIYDPEARAAGLGKHETVPTTWRVKGNLFLSANQWSSERIPDDRGRPSGYAFYFDFANGRRVETQVGYSMFRHALCVRGPTG